MKKTILISLYRNFSIRYLLETNLIHVLKKNYHVHLLIDKKIYGQYKNVIDKSIIIHKYEFQKIEHERKNFLNGYLIILRKLISGSKYFYNSTVKFRQIQYKFVIKNKLYYFVILYLSKLINNFIFLRRFYNWLEKFFYNINLFDSLLKKIKPSAIIIGSCCIDHDGLISLSARKKKIPIFSLIYSWDNPSSKGYPICKPNYVFTWNKVMSDDVENFFEINKSNIFNVGILHWSKYNKIITKKIKLKSKNIFSFFSSAQRNFENAYQNLVEILETLKILYKKNFNLIVRMHPNFFLNSKEMIKNRKIQKTLKKKFGNKIIFFNPKISLIKRKKNDIKLNLKDDMVTIKSIISKSNLVITQYSTIILEAAIFKKPIINYFTGNYRNTPFSKKIMFEKMHHLKRINSYNAFKNCDNKKNLELEIINILKKKKSYTEQKKLLYRKEVGNINNYPEEKIIKILKKYV